MNRCYVQFGLSSGYNPRFGVPFLVCSNQHKFLMVIGVICIMITDPENVPLEKKKERQLKFDHS